MLPQARQPYLGRRMRMTRSRAGTQSSISLTVSPIACRAPPQQGQAFTRGRGSHPRVPDARAGSADRIDRGGWFLVGRHRRQQFLGPADVGTEILQPQLELIAIEPFGPPAELQALQLLHDQPQPFDLGLGLGERLAFAARSAASCRIS